MAPAGVLVMAPAELIEIPTNSLAIFEEFGLLGTTRMEETHGPSNPWIALDTVRDPEKVSTGNSIRQVLNPQSGGRSAG